MLTLEKLDVRAGLIARLGRLAAQSEGFVVALKPGHSGGAKGPWFQDQRRTQQGT